MKAVILAGGGGTRLWPLSTKSQPKQFQKLVSEKTLIEETIDRLDFLDPKDIFIAINKEHLGLVQKYCTKIPAENIIIEPALRDTAACIGLATVIIESKYPDSCIAIIYADHLIKNKAEFQKKLKLAQSIAESENTLNIIEVEAKDPNTNYGYVKIGRELQEDVFEIENFTEKPDLTTAQKFVKSKNHLWNTGLYVWQAKTLLEKYREQKPEMYQDLIKMATNPNEIASNYPNLEKISIDYAIMEKIDPSCIRIIKADLQWSDIGNWEAVYLELAKNDGENITRGKTELIDCENCLIYSDNDKKIAAIGLKDKVIVDTPDGLLISDMKSAKRVKEVKQEN